MDNLTDNELNSQLSVPVGMTPLTNPHSISEETEKVAETAEQTQWKTTLKFLAEIINRLDRIEMKVTRMQSKIKSDEQVI